MYLLDSKVLTYGGGDLCIEPIYYAWALYSRAYTVSFFLFIYDDINTAFSTNGGDVIGKISDLTRVSIRWGERCHCCNLFLTDNIKSINVPTVTKT